MRAPALRSPDRRLWHHREHGGRSDARRRVQTDNSATDSGAVYVYVRAGATWSQAAYVKASNTDADDDFGSLVVVSPDATTLVVGADGEASASTGVGGDQTDNSAPQSGASYVIQ